MTAPILTMDWTDLAACAARLHAERVAGYPARVATGQLTPEAAADGIRIMAAIADEWRRALAVRHGDADPGPAEGCEAYPTEMRATTAIMRDRARRAYDKAVAALPDHAAAGPRSGSSAERVNISQLTHIAIIHGARTGEWQHPAIDALAEAWQLWLWIDAIAWWHDKRGPLAAARDWAQMRAERSARSAAA